MRLLTQRVGLVLFALTLAAVLTAAHVSPAAARPWLGVYTQEITGDLRDGMDLPEGTGVLVNRVVSGGPAERAGLRQGDVIVRLDSHTVESPQDLASMVGEAHDRQVVRLEVLRHGDRRTFSVTLASRSDEDTPEPPAAPRAPRAPERLEDMGHRNDAPQADDQDGNGHRDVKVKIYRNGGDAPDADDNDNNGRSDVKVKVFRKGGDAPDSDDNDNDNNGRSDVKVKVFRNGGDGPQTFHFDGNLDQLPGHVREMLRDVPGLDGNGGLHALRLMGASRGRLGVRIESLNPDLAGALGVSGDEGVLVLEVMSDTPAEKAGLRSGDVILTVDGKDVKNAEALVSALGDVDGKVSITVSRKGSRRTVEAELASAPRAMHGNGPMRMGRDRSAGPDRGDRARDPEGSDPGNLRQQMDQLRQQMRELRQQLEDRKHE